MKADDQAIVNIYRELGSQQAVADRLGMSQSGVSGALRRAGVQVGRGGAQRKHSDQAIQEAFEHEGSAYAAAHRLGVNPTTIERRLRRMGIYLESRGRRPTHDLPMNEVAARYQAGESTGQLAQAYGVDAEVIRRRLRTHGTTRRQAGPPAGKRNPQWKGGKEPTMHAYRRQAYEVAAICLGRPLPVGWVIHHMDENDRNNRPENLATFESQSVHARFHQQLLRLQRAGQPVDATRLALESGARALPPPPHPIEF